MTKMQRQVMLMPFWLLEVMSSDGGDPFDTANHIFSRGWLCSSECPCWRKKPLLLKIYGIV